MLKQKVITILLVVLLTTLTHVLAGQEGNQDCPPEGLKEYKRVFIDTQAKPGQYFYVYDVPLDKEALENTVIYMTFYKIPHRLEGGLLFISCAKADDKEWVANATMGASDPSFVAFMRQMLQKREKKLQGPQ